MGVRVSEPYKVLDGEGLGHSWWSDGIARLDGGNGTPWGQPNPSLGLLASRLVAGKRYKWVGLNNDPAPLAEAPEGGFYSWLCVADYTGPNYKPEPEFQDVPDDDDGAAHAIRSECDAIRDELLAKNERYGSAALDPLGIAAKGLSPEAGIRVRIDDKLKRWQTQGEDDDEDTVADLVGYLILLRVQRRLRR